MEAIQPIQDLVTKALDSRPDLAQSRIQIDNAEIALTGTKNALLPTLSTSLAICAATHWWDNRTP